MLICPPGRVHSVLSADRHSGPAIPAQGHRHLTLCHLLQACTCSTRRDMETQASWLPRSRSRSKGLEFNEYPLPRATRGQLHAGRSQPGSLRWEPQADLALEEGSLRSQATGRARLSDTGAPGVRQVPVWTELCRPLLPRSRDSMTCPFPLHRRTCSQSCPSQTARSSPSTLPCPWRTPQRIMPGN